MLKLLIVVNYCDIRVASCVIKCVQSFLEILYLVQEFS